MVSNTAFEAAQAAALDTDFWTEEDALFAQNVDMRTAVTALKAAIAVATALAQKEDQDMDSPRKQAQRGAHHPHGHVHIAARTHLHCFPDVPQVA